MNFEVEERVDRLETLLGQFIVQTNTALNRLERGLERFKEEMQVFKNEMRDFKEEMKVFKDEMSDFKDEMSDFKDEMSDFKNEMREYRDRQDGERLRMNRQWGDLANKLGTVVEDLVFPSFERIVLERFNKEIETLMPRLKRKLQDGRKKEFDIVGIAGDFVFLNSTKTTLKSQYVDDFINEIKLFWEFYPEYRNKTLIGILASLYIDKSVIKFAEKKGFLVIGVGYEIMEIKNRADFEPKKWTYDGN